MTRGDINNNWDIGTYILLIVINTILCIKVLWNFYKLRKMRKNKLSNSLNTLRCINSNVFL